MNRTTTILVLALVSSLLTPVVVSATGTNQKQAASVEQAKVETAAVTTTASTSKAAEEPGCRRVKVVYAGYGEAKNTPCAVTADVRR